MSRRMYALYCRGDKHVRPSSFRIGGPIADCSLRVADAVRPAIVVDEHRSAAPLKEHGTVVRSAATGRLADRLNEPGRQLALELFKASCATGRRPLGALVCGDRVVDALLRPPHESAHRRAAVSG